MLLSRRLEAAAHPSSSGEERGTVVETVMELVDGRPKEPCGLSVEHLTRLPDPHLMAHLSAGHHDALAVLFDRYHRLVLSVAFKILRDASEAEDVMQSVFLEIYRAAGQFDTARGSVKIWLLQYAYHRSLNRRDYLKLRGYYERKRDAVGHPGSSETADGDAAPGLLTLPEVRCLVREGLESLNHSQRRTLHLAYFEDMPLQEIARKTGESLGKVRHHYYRGIRRLRALFLNHDENRNGNRTRKVSYEIARPGGVDAKA
jgi:RNA polymerase sigma-70 factor (ECF subfamily)